VWHEPAVRFCGINLIVVVAVLMPAVLVAVLMMTLAATADSALAVAHVALARV
jgi:hypothetical protein